MGQQIRHRRSIMSFVKESSVDELQSELYDHFGATTEDQKRNVQGWPLIKKFYDQVLRKRKSGYEERSAEQIKRRKKVHVEADPAPIN